MPIPPRFKTPLTLIAVIAGATLIATFGYRLIYANNPFGEIFSISKTVLDPSSVQRQLLNKQKVPAPDFVGIQGWLNTENNQPLTLAQLRGKVVLVDFWTYSCINCIRTLPYLVEWDKKYRDKGLVIVGVHTPEFNFEKDPINVKNAMAQYGIQYPVALDPDYKTWRAYNNHFWPAKYFIDHEGNIVWQHFGEGQYQQSEQVIQQLLIDAGLMEAPMALNPESSDVDFQKIGTPEIYFGYNRIDHFGGTPVPDAPFSYTAPSQPKSNTFYLDGRWQIGPEHAELVGPTGKIIIRYSAKTANIVFDAGAPVQAVVRLDGQYLTQNQLGSDVRLEQGKSVVEITEPRLYNFTNTPEYGEHVLELEFSQPGVRAFAFTFG